MAVEGNQSVSVKKLTERFGDGIIDSSVYKDEVTLRVDKGALVSICDFLKTEPAYRMDYLVDVIGVDYMPASPRFEVVYHLYSISKRHRIRLKVKIDESESIPTVTGIWPAADWPEREAYDMYGIIFDGHPNLKRIYMAPDWEGFPLRKDYPLRGYKDKYNPFGEEKEELL
jgi:NADH-quinone oxidoreductase subunit C